MLVNRKIAIVLILLICGCSDKSEPEATAQLSANTLPGNYSGVFPCDACPGIESTLWLRSDKRFFFSQQYPPNETHEAVGVYSLGRWNINPEDRTVSLTSEGPVRTFTRPDADTMSMQTDTGLDHLLTRDTKIPDFTATIRMQGTVQTGGDGVIFTECLSGLKAAVSRGGDYSRFRNQLRSVGRVGAPTLVELQGRFNWSSTGALQTMTIEEFGTIKVDAGC